MFKGGLFRGSHGGGAGEEREDLQGDEGLYEAENRSEGDEGRDGDSRVSKTGSRVLHGRC